MLIRNNIEKFWRQKFNYKTFILKKFKFIKIYQKIIINLIITLLIFIFKISNNIKNLYINNAYLNIKKDLNLNFKNKLLIKIRIAIYCTGIKNGGVERLTSILVNYFDKIKIFKIYLFTIRNKEEDEYIIPKNIKRINISFIN